MIKKSLESLRAGEKKSRTASASADINHAF